MPDNTYSSIFGTSTTPVALSLGKRILTIAGDNNTSYKLAVNSLRYTFSRTMTPYYPLNAADIGKILVAGEPVGQLTLTYLMGVGTNVTAFLKKFSDVCSIDSNSMSIDVGTNSDCGNNATNTFNVNQKFTFTGMLITSVSGDVTRSERGNLCVGTVTMSFMDMVAQ
jgi:hypothetical protein